LTHQNDSILAGLEMNAPETFWFDGAEGTKVQAMLIRPPKIRRREKVSTAGGPSWRAADDVGKFVGLPVEPAGFLRGRIRDADDQPARLDRLRTKVHG